MNYSLTGRRAAIILTVVFGLSNIVHAEPTAVRPTTEDADIATVERVIPVTSDRDLKISIQLVQVSNGGATDLSAYMSPSTLFLTAFRIGEERDASARYIVSRDVVSVISAKLGENGKSLTVETTHREFVDGIKLLNGTSTIDMSGLLQDLSADRVQDITAPLNVEREIQ